MQSLTTIISREAKNRKVFTDFSGDCQNNNNDWVSTKLLFLLQTNLLQNLQKKIVRNEIHKFLKWALLQQH